MSTNAPLGCTKLRSRLVEGCPGDFTTEHFASLAGIGESGFEIFHDILINDISSYQAVAQSKLNLYKGNVKAFLVKVLENENESWECPLHSVHAHFYRNILNNVKGPVKKKMVEMWLDLWDVVVTDMIAVDADGEKENLELLRSMLETSFEIMKDADRCESSDASPDACGCVIS